MLRFLNRIVAARWSILLVFQIAILMLYGFRAFERAGRLRSLYGETWEPTDIGPTVCFVACFTLASALTAFGCFVSGRNRGV